MIHSKITEEFQFPMTFRLGLMNEVMGPNSEFMKIGIIPCLLLQTLLIQEITLFRVLLDLNTVGKMAYLRLGNRMSRYSNMESGWRF